MKNRIAYIVSMTIILIAIVLVIIAGFLAFIPITVVHPNVQPYKVLTTQVHTGDTFEYIVDACKYREAPTTLIRRFVDEKGLSYPLPPQQSNVKVGCKKTTIPIIIPDTLHPGTWYLTLDVAYRVNPLRTESYHFTTDTFNIIKE